MKLWRTWRPVALAWRAFEAVQTILHILTKPEDALAREIIALQQGGNKESVRVADLTGPAPDYEALVREIFEADAVTVW